MTAQISDQCLFKRRNYDLIGVDGGELASPEQFGMEPEMLDTSCYRGFYANYSFIKNVLYLRKLTFKEKNGLYLPIQGIEPLGTGYYTGYCADYENLKALCET